MTRLILASASPRRRELLSRVGIPFDVSPTEVAEDTGADGDAQRAARWQPPCRSDVEPMASL